MTISDMQTILCSMARNSIRLTIGGQPDTGVGAGRFGGVPDVPADFTWPVFETATYDDDDVKPRPLAFLAQVCCAALAPYDTDGLLPKTGVLSFFYELGSQRWGYDPADRGCARVFWFPETAELSPAAFRRSCPPNTVCPLWAFCCQRKPPIPVPKTFMPAGRSKAVTGSHTGRHGPCWALRTRTTAPACWAGRM